MLSFDKDRRAFPRANYPCKIVLSAGAGKKDFYLHTENISAGGIRVILAEKLEVGQVVNIELFAEIIPMKCRGKVIWCVDIKPINGDKTLLFDVGIEFADIARSDQERLQSLVEDLLK